jgi:ribose-phosphate pyrophosphokinase
MSRSPSRALVLGFPEYAEQAQRLSARAGLGYAQVDVHRFPDGESRVRLPGDLPPRVVLCRSLDRPNNKLVELMLSTRAARELGAEVVTLVAPYLCYMRQDKAFAPGEVVSQRIVGRLLADLFDAVVTVDPHLHRVKRLEEAVPVARARALTAAPLMAEFLRSQLHAPLLVGPDSESEQWVSAIAAGQGLEYLIGAKERLGDRTVRVTFSLPARCRDRHVVLVDDVASTGRTLEAAAMALAAGGPASVSVLVTHALFLDGTLDRLRAIGVDRVWSTDSITHPTNRLHLAPLLAGALSD